MISSIPHLVLFPPLVGSIILAILCFRKPSSITHLIAITMVGISTVSSLILLYIVFNNPQLQTVYQLYDWMSFSTYKISFGYFIDLLSAIMACTVTFVSFMVHLFTIGYMKDDKSYTRFFCYLNLFTFSMLLLIFSPNLVQLFFGWEGVGVVSYLLIGFWYERPSAIKANYKAFIVNRLGDIGLLIAIAIAFSVFSTLDIEQMYSQFESSKNLTLVVFDHQFSAISLFAFFIFVGAMGKSAQVPLHVWLPDSMEGPTPISALIHAATMVTAGIFLVVRFHPFFSSSTQLLDFILIIGTITSLFMGLIGIVQSDIKRIIAYSTLSQLGLMVVALGVQAYAFAIFHLVTHAFFKALLFLCAGSVIHSMHHEQNIFKMGDLKKKLPITCYTMIVGTLALTGFPLFSGFFSKDLILHSLHNASTPVAHYTYWLMVIGVFVTTLYSWRLIFVVFFSKSKQHHHDKIEESNLVITIPLLLLAIPSFLSGLVLMPIFTDTNFLYNYGLIDSVTKQHIITISEVIKSLFINPAFYSMSIGMATAWYCYSYKPEIPGILSLRLVKIYNLLLNKYWIDELYAFLFCRPITWFSAFIWKRIDNQFIDSFLVHGTANSFLVIAKKIRMLQTGLLYHYIFLFLVSVTFLLLIIFFMP
ncbi:MAG: NADH-quinone oxidoreductase subunit L [Methylacidiphilales bacterium]|nr:NADH-quinone oxidoreductase subunit L [Candidatus Methylacidiphilales bacterium]